MWRTKRKNRTETIFYLGFGSRRNGHHTRKQFLRVMNHRYRKSCAAYQKSKHTSCKGYGRMRRIDVGRLLKDPNAAEPRGFTAAKRRCDKVVAKPCSLQGYKEYAGIE
jgi:hypothetical protein